MTTSNRRKFMKQSGMITSGIIAAPALSQANFFSGASGEIKIALIGCGGRGTGAAVQALKSKQNVKLVAMADAFQDRVESSLKSIKNELSESGLSTTMVDVPAERQFVGFDGYLKAIPLADVVILTTPPGFRPIHFEEAVKQNKHIFMEKPVATDTEGIKKVLAVAEQAKAKKLNVVVGLQRHYQNSYRELFKRKDLIGEITSAQAWWNNDGVWVNARKAGQTEMEYQMRNWYYFNWLCGDHITEQHIHNIDVINWFKGSYPVKAQGMGGREVRKGKDHGEIFDHHYVEFHYADGSILNSQCRHIKNTMSKVDELIVGTKGKIYCGAASIRDNKGTVVYQFDRKTENDPYQSEHDELFAAIAKGEYKFADAENGAKSTMTSIMGRMATYSGRMIEWDKALQSGMNLQPTAYTWDTAPRSLPDANGDYKVAVPGVTKFY